MDAQFIAVIQNLITEKGKEALFSAAKCKALLADYTKGEYNKESRLLLQAVEAGAAKNIAETAELANCKALMVKKLQDEHFLSGGAAADVVGMLALVLRGDVSAAEAADEDEWEPATVGTAPQTPAAPVQIAVPVTPPQTTPGVQAPPSVTPAAQTPVQPQPLPLADAKKRKDALILILLSIGVFAWFSLFLYVEGLWDQGDNFLVRVFVTLSDIGGDSFCLTIYGIIYAWFALIAGRKYQSKALKVSSVIALVLFFVATFAGYLLNKNGNEPLALLWGFSSLAAGLYTIFFIILTLITAIRMRKTKPKETN